ncbi:MAG: hypothetical protein BGO98_27315 [Myxococcales bacterium 68-20]|nr:hypothetical protein [Myxococcales bacterium]OJY30433.1 MAG: hypothetical protein BGO98_27315 [Myxococcales bacterium 68-20]
MTSVPDAPENGEVVVRLIAGTSALSEMAFPIGRAAPLVSVGARGDWQVRGGDVAPVHLVLAFNGEGLFACVRDGSRLSIDGARVTSSGWVPVPVGATLELGEVRLTVMTNRVCAPASTPAPPSSIPTRAMRLTRARSVEVSAWPTPPRIRRRAESSGALSLLRDLRSATVVESSGPAFGTTTQVVPPSARARRSMAETASGPFATVLVPPAAPDARPVDASLAGSFGTTQLVPPIVRDRRMSMPPARASSPGERRPSSLIRLPATDSYSDAPPPVEPAGPLAPVPMDPRASGGARAAAIESFGVTRMVPPMAWRAPLGTQRASPMFDSFAPTRLAPPLASSNVSGGHPLPDPMLASRIGAASPKGAGPIAMAPAPAAPNEASAPRVTADRVAGSFVRAWHSSSQPRKAIVVLLGPALLAAVLSLRGSAAPAHAPSMPPVASSATAQVSAAPAPSASEANADAARTRGTTTSGNASAASSRLAPEPSAVERDPPAAAAESPAAVTEPQPPGEVGPRSASSSKAAQRKTAERRALDAVAAGAGDAELYDALAKENADNPAFSEAARILRARASEAR